MNSLETMKIKLIEPTRYNEDGTLLKSKYLFNASLTMPLIAALTPNDFEVSIVNELFDEIDFDEKVNLVGITSYTPYILRAYEIADEFRKRGVPVVMGGIHVSMEPEEALAHADTLIIGEGEEIWPQFLDDFTRGRSKKVYKAQKRPSLENLPVPRFSLLNLDKYFGYKRKGLFRFLNPCIPVQTARGCPNACDYCSVTRYLGPRLRPRPIPDVVNEIKALRAKFIFFVDDNIFADPRRAFALFRAITPLKLWWFGQATIDAAQDEALIEAARLSGCVALCLGIESISRKSLESVSKKANKVELFGEYLKVFRKKGIAVAASMMFGFDDEELSVFKNTYEFLVKNRITYSYWWPITPLPKTSFYKRLHDQGRLKEERWWLNPHRKYYGLDFTRTSRGDDEFIKTLYQYYRRFYSFDSILKRNFLPPGKWSFLHTLVNFEYRKRLTPQTNVIEY